MTNHIPYDDRPDLYDSDPRLDPDLPLADVATEEGTEVAYYESCAELALLRIWARRCIIPGCKAGRLSPGTLTCGDQGCMQELGLWPDTLRGYLTEYRQHHPGREAEEARFEWWEAVSVLSLAISVVLWMRGAA